MNFTGYLAKLSEYMEQVNKYCPQLDQYKEIFNEFPRFREAVDYFYAIVIGFCTDTLKIVQGQGIYFIFSFSYTHIGLWYGITIIQVHNSNHFS